MYYKSSEGIVRLGDELSDRFVIEEGVKQGGIISPLLFNFFINDLLVECLGSELGARVGGVITCIIGYCDDLILLSPLASHLRRLLAICERYAEKWKIKFNASKSTVYCTHKNVYLQEEFYIAGGLLRNVENFEYLGLPIGEPTYLEDFFEKKFRSVEKSFFSIRRIGLHSKLTDPECLSFFYKQFCQSIFLYGLELVHLSKSLIKQLQSRQALIIKMALGLSKYCRNSPLLEALNISSIIELYYKFKYLFIGQLKNHWVAYSLYKEVMKSCDKKSTKASFCVQMIEIESFLITEQDRLGMIDIFKISKKEALDRIRNRFKCDNQGLVDSVRTALHDSHYRGLVGLLLRVDFRPDFRTAAIDEDLTLLYFDV